MNMSSQILHWYGDYQPTADMGVWISVSVAAENAFLPSDVKSVERFRKSLRNEYDRPLQRIEETIPVQYEYVIQQ